MPKTIEARRKGKREGAQAWRVPDAAAALDVPQSTMYQAIKDGDVPAIKVLNSLRIPDWWMEDQIGRPEDVAAA